VLATLSNREAMHHSAGEAGDRTNSDLVSLWPRASSLAPRGRGARDDHSRHLL